MADPSKVNDGLPQAEADARFDRAIKNALAMPPKPHNTKTPPGEPRGGKGSVPEKG